MVCIESYIGRDGGNEGVKLEQQVLITNTGTETLSRYSLDLQQPAGTREISAGPATCGARHSPRHQAEDHDSPVYRGIKKILFVLPSACLCEVSE